MNKNTHVFFMKKQTLSSYVFKGNNDYTEVNEKQNIKKVSPFITNMKMNFIITHFKEPHYLNFLYS